jgi:mycofactocin precursor
MTRGNLITEPTDDTQGADAGEENTLIEDIQIDGMCGVY